MKNRDRGIKRKAERKGSGGGRGGKEVRRVAFSLHLGPLSNFCIIRPLILGL